MIEAGRLVDSQLALQEVTQHATENPMPAWPGRSCIDGRYQAGQGSGMISRPGADFGYVMVLLAINKAKQLGLPPQECVDRITEVVAAESGEFYMHSGCAHITKAATPTLAGAYGVDPEDIKQAHAYAKSQTRTNEVPLYGEHEEQGVIVVTGTRRTVGSFDHHRNRMYFIYDKTRDKAFMDRLVALLGIDGATSEEFRAMSDRHMGQTLKLLALGKQIFTVNADGPRPVISLAGRVTV